MITTVTHIKTMSATETLHRGVFMGSFLVSRISEVSAEISAIVSTGDNSVKAAAAWAVLVKERSKLQEELAVIEHTKAYANA
jgi:hypothetical protein